MNDGTLDLARSVLTALAMLSFLGIVAWAYSRPAQKGFEEAANLPFADEDEGEIRNSDTRNGGGAA
jgi:cytochrome c oxidase cbb3-type subunit IV